MQPDRYLSHKNSTLTPRINSNCPSNCVKQFSLFSLAKRPERWILPPSLYLEGCYLEQQLFKDSNWEDPDFTGKIDKILIRKGTARRSCWEAQGFPTKLLRERQSFKYVSPCSWLWLPTGLQIFLPFSLWLSELPTEVMTMLSTCYKESHPLPPDLNSSISPQSTYPSVCFLHSLHYWVPLVVTLCVPFYKDRKKMAVQGYFPLHYPLSFLESSKIIFKFVETE